MAIFPVLFSSLFFVVIWIFIIGFILARFAKIQKETKARSVYQTVKQNPKLQPKKQPLSSAPKTESFSPNTTNTIKQPKSDLFDKEKPKKSRSLFGNGEPDCDLDERVFGPKNQHKDIF